MLREIIFSLNKIKGCCKDFSKEQLEVQRQRNILRNLLNDIETTSLNDDRINQKCTTLLSAVSDLIDNIDEL